MRMVIAMAIAATLTACGQTEPRSLQYFEGHLDEAREVIEACASDAHRGDECQNAATAFEIVEAREKFKRFRGK